MFSEEREAYNKIRATTNPFLNKAGNKLMEKDFFNHIAILSSRGNYHAVFLLVAKATVKQRKKTRCYAKFCLHTKSGGHRAGPKNGRW